MMTGYEFSAGKFQDVTWLIAEADRLYERIHAAHGITRPQLTRDKIVELRKWSPALPLIAKNFEAVLKEMDVFYVPAVLDPGPCIVFPQRDVYGNYRRARVKPMWDLVLGGQVVKYAGIGLKKTFVGPAWIGNTRTMIERILKYRSVLIVEGPFDILAVKLLCPDLPVLSAGTDHLGAKYLDYLRMLGVKTIHLMFDQDAPDAQGKSPGVDAMSSLQRRLERTKDWFLRAVSVVCPTKDPAHALTGYRTAVELRARLRLWMESL